MTLLPRHQIPHLPPQHHTPAHGPQQPHNPLARPPLSRIVKQMQEAPGIDDVDVAIQRTQRAPRIEDVALDKRAAERVAVAEQRVAQLPELAPQVAAVEVLAGRAVGREPPHVLPEAAAEVEELVVGCLESLQDGGVVGREGDGEVEEAELSYAGVWPDLPGTITLRIVSEVGLMESYNGGWP